MLKVLSHLLKFLDVNLIQRSRASKRSQYTHTESFYLKKTKQQQLPNYEICAGRTRTETEKQELKESELSRNGVYK